MVKDRPINERLMQAVLYILKKLHSSDVGMKKLAKLLYFSDFNYYKKKHQSITGEVYKRLEHGPIPDRLYDVVNQLHDRGIISAEIKDYSDFVKWDFQVLEDMPLTLLSSDELKQIDQVLSKLSSMSAKRLEDLSHKDTPWLVSDMYEEIPYKLVFYRSDDIEEAVE